MLASRPRVGTDVRPLLRHRLLAAAGLLLVPAIVLATPGVADAAPTRDRADAGGGWLARQLDRDSRVIVGDFGPDYGLTADTVLALDAAGVAKVASRRATTRLKRHVVDYTGGGDANEYYAGSFAKLVVLAAERGTDPTSFGGSDRMNLVAELRGLECGTRGRNDCATGDDGRFSDISQYGDFSNVIGQSLALIGLERATKRGPSAAAIRFLRKQQCDNGAFPVTVGTGTCSGDVDATGFAVQALVAIGGGRSLAAAKDAGRWLGRQQHGNGSFTGTGTRNANSTALAAQAFDALDRTKRYRKARKFLRSLQVRCSGAAADRGSVLYNRAGNGDEVRATAQAVPALAGVNLTELDHRGARRAAPRLAC